ncbi:MAG: hypothetical protein AAF191_08890, partial [Verrucomicrobiota bacterium]
GLEVGNLKILGLTDGEHSTEASMQFEVAGELSKILLWLYQLQQPNAFREVRTVVMTPKEEESEDVSAVLTLVAHYQPR